MPTPDSFHKKIEAAGGPAPEGEAFSYPDQWSSPEEGAEQLYAIWRDYNRQKIELYRASIEEAGGPESTGALSPGERQELMDQIETDPTLAPMKEAIRARWQDENIQTRFKETLARALADQERIVPSYAYQLSQAMRTAAASLRDTIYQDIFSHRMNDPDELTLLELADLEAKINIADQMAMYEMGDPEVAAKLSFERLTRYRDQLSKSGFIWTPSRETIFANIIEKAVLLNRNRPISLVGETGTGKTELARALARRLTGAEPARTTARDQTDPGRSLGFRSLEGVAFGTLGQALTGKKSSTDTQPGPGQIAFLDEANKYPEDFIRMLVKTLAGRRPGDPISFEEWYGEDQPLAAQALLVLGMNLPDTERGRHLDRPDFSPEVKRELAPTTITVDYMPQTAENPELFEVLLAAAMDKNGRIRIPSSDISPAYKPVVREGRHTQVIDEAAPSLRGRGPNLEVSAPAPGGALWRFAGLIHETQKLYTGEPNVLTPLRRDEARLDQAVLETGLAIGWIEEYKKSALRRKIPLAVFLSEKLTAWAGAQTKGGQHLFSSDDRIRLHELFLAFGFDAESAKNLAPSPLANLTPQEIGSLSPRVPRAVATLERTPAPTEYKATAADGSEIVYQKIPHNDFAPGSRIQHKTALNAPIRTFLGLEKGTDNAVLEDEEGNAFTVFPDVLARYERVKTNEIRVIDAPNPWREHLIAGGIPDTDPAAAETIEVTLNIPELLTKEAEAYRARNLPHWADALEAIRDDLRLDPDKLRIIEQEIRDGAIPILMPGKDALQATTPEQLTTTLKPLWIKEGNPEILEDTHLWDHLQAFMQVHYPTLTEHVPDRPYLSFMKPTAKVDPRTTEKTVGEQKQELLRINQERQVAGRPEAHPTNPFEYVALQDRATARLQNQSPQPLTTLTPLDDANYSYTRFINLPSSLDGRVPLAYFNLGDRKVAFGGYAAAAQSRRDGFRLSVRVEL